MNFVNVKFERIEGNGKGKAKYLVNGKELSAEQAAAHYYAENGYSSIWSENNYWWMLMGLLFWEVIFAKVYGAVQVSVGGTLVTLSPDENEYNKLFEQTVKLNGMPSDFFTADFYKRRESLIKNRIRELSSKDLEQTIITAHKKYYGLNFRMIENWERFSVDELTVVAKRLQAEKIFAILERILIDVSENRSGLPDLLVYNNETLFMSEVKGEKDKLTDKQMAWHDFLQSIGLTVQLCFINHTEKQIANLKKKAEENKKLVTVSFGFSSSKKLDEAIAFAKEQGSYFTEGEGKEQTHGAVFDINDIEKLYRMLDLTSGWKSQKISIDGNEIKSTELRNALWCFREKKKTGASADYCKEETFYGQGKNPYNCKQVRINPNKWIEFGYISSDSGDWVINKEELTQKFDEIISVQSHCPLFDEKKVRQVISKVPERINPKTDKGWAYISNDHDHWLFSNDKWITRWGSKEFPGISAMVGVEKLSKKDINEAVKYAQSFRDGTILAASTNKVRDSGKKKSGCFVATAVYSDHNAPQVLVLRGFRDSVLSRNMWGRGFVQVYYIISPPIAEFLSNNKAAKHIVKTFLDRIVAILS
ncbi:CFI-box-CTERM domain-containing protein [Dethiobacter alkaliphilus]|uniref:CFI-box-CTERM domain-containing protein n=1 Tax=Dethiobacter alkaliphilus TaxID=427926 RepID=UPI00222686C1|nr:CFI-box-CTERM domain-containing protein [Dethiobacter alkaliphilus]MCW3491536.1 VRR-NUC domain-containing protein [Dethiobacter alkaliphilus]